jgi:predicted regulator of Ras-like GTPase activity (Roadblock/LC7/MglB family)
MASIRDLITTLRARDGIAAAILLGRDGLVIDGQVAADLDLEQVAALVAPILQAADDFGAGAGRGALQTAVLELPGGLAVISPLSADGVLLVLAEPTATVGPLLYELRRHREQMASLV